MLKEPSQRGIKKTHKKQTTKTKLMIQNKFQTKVGIILDSAKPQGKNGTCIFL